MLTLLTLGCLRHVSPYTHAPVGEVTGGRAQRQPGQKLPLRNGVSCAPEDSELHGPN